MEMKTKTKAKTKIKTQMENKMKTKAKAKAKPKWKTKTQMKSKIKTKTKMRIKMNFRFCFHFCFWFCFGFLNFFCVFLTPPRLEVPYMVNYLLIGIEVPQRFVNSTWPRGAIDCQLPFTWLKSATAFLFANSACGLAVP